MKTDLLSVCIFCNKTTIFFCLNVFFGGIQVSLYFYHLSLLSYTITIFKTLRYSGGSRRSIAQSFSLSSACCLLFSSDAFLFPNLTCLFPGASFWRAIHAKHLWNCSAGRFFCLTALTHWPKAKVVTKNNDTRLIRGLEIGMSKF